MATDSQVQHAIYRGVRVLDIVDAVISQLAANGMGVNRDDARVAIFETIADALYGATTPVDIPPLRRS